MTPASRFLAVVLALVCCALMPAAANATGTLNILRHDGSKDSYTDVEVKIFQGTLFLTSDDGDGTIVVTGSACSFQGKILVCLPTAAALVQEGESDSLNLKTGTIYFNYTSAAQSLSHSSTKVPPNSIVLALRLKDDTYINVRGKIDEVVSE